MSAPKSDIQGYLSLLAKHSDLIDQTYRSLTVRDDGTASAAIYELQNARILIFTGEGEYRLATGIKALLDDYTQKQRSFAAGQNISGEIDSLCESLAAYEKAVFAGSAEDRDRLLDDIHYSIGAIHDTVSQDLLRFQQATEINFSTEVSLAEKAQQNEYFLKQAKGLEEILRALTGKAIHMRFENDVLTDLRRLYRREVEDHIGAWSDTLVRTIDILQKYLYRHRQVTLATRRMRGLGSFLRKNSMQVVEDALQGSAGDLSILRHVGEDFPAPYPDFISPEGQDRLLPVVQRMQPAEQRVTEVRVSGKRARGGDIIEVPEQLSPEEEALSVFLEKAKTSDSWVSAEHAFHEMEEIELVDLLEEILNWAATVERATHQVRPVYRAGKRAREANAEIRDIEVCRVA